MTTRYNAKVRETTCGYAKGVDGVNIPQPPPGSYADPGGLGDGSTTGEMEPCSPSFGDLAVRDTPRWWAGDGMMIEARYDYTCR